MDIIQQQLINRESVTLCIIKPDAYEKRAEICMALGSQFSAIGMKDILFKKAVARVFYAEHQGKGFFTEHIEFMCSGPCLAIILLDRTHGAIERLRKCLGNTNPALAELGTLRRRYGTNLPRNAAHGSDSAESVSRELHLLFSGLELIELGINF